MSLWLIKKQAPALQYNPWDGVVPPIHYNDWLVTPPRIYDEAINNVRHWFYEPSNDLLVAYMFFDTYHWPSWAAWRYDFNAETGAFIERSQASVIRMAWTNHAGRGSYNKIYATMNTEYKIREVYWDNLVPSGWSIDPWTWTPPTIFNHVVVNREDKLLAGVSTWTLDIWDFSGTPTRRAQLRLPNTLGYLAYESRKILWLSTKDGLVAKANYKSATPRWELLSSVQNPSPDAINYLVTFDQLRHRLAIFRHRPDAEDGACQCEIEFYRTIPRYAGLTDPVPVSRLRANKRVEFVAHIYGDNGEGVTPYRIDAEMEPPVEGELITPFGMTGLSGAASFYYQAPAAACQETLNLSATITDGD